MKYTVSILLLLLVSTNTYAETKHGLELAPLDKREYHLSTFISLFKEHCYRKDSPKTVINELSKSKEVSESKDYEGMYEVFHDGLSYAITAEPNKCVVDILLEYEPGKLLYGLKEIISAIESFENHTIDVSKEITELGPSEERVLTSEITFTNSNQNTNKLVLTYPLDNQDVWYMTLSYQY